MDIPVPELSLVVLVGPSGSGKSSFARTHFRPTEVLSSDECRGLVSDDENDQSATKDAFDVLHYIAAKRLERARLTVVDATNVQEAARKPLIALARTYHCLPVAIVLNLPETVCYARNRGRADRQFGPHVIRRQHEQMRRSIRHLQKEGFRHVFVLQSEEEVDAATVVRQPLYSNRKWDHGPFDIIGDVHGCGDELEELLSDLGYVADAAGTLYAHPGGRRAIFLGDLADRGPRIVDTLCIVQNMVQAGNALCIPGNHDMKLLRKLQGRDVQITYGLADTLAQLDALPNGRRQELVEGLIPFLDGLISHYVLDDGKLVVAHAGLKEEMQGRGSREVRAFALYGETTGETDEFGLPIRLNWAAEYRGHATVVYGHTPVQRPEWLNKTINIDTGCVFGGSLSALRYPEREILAVPARAVYYESARRFLPEEERAETLTAQQREDDLLDIDDVLGKRIIRPRGFNAVTVREDQAIPALEVMSRFAANPKWLIYLPPTMAPAATSQHAGLLEHPAEAFSYFRSQGVPRVVCEEKHMGSRAVVVVCRDEAAALARFGVAGESGIIYTRTGRPFFEDRELERRLLDRVRSAIGAAGLWERFETDWFCLDCELMPWSAKAQDLLRHQYAAVGAAARAALADAAPALAKARDRGVDADGEAARLQERALAADKFVAAYRRYSWPVHSLVDLKLAPFHLLASEGHVHSDRDHVWHMQTIGEICAHDREILCSTRFREVDVTDEESEQAGTRWWDELTERGGEGMVVKPLAFVQRDRHKTVQPAVKVRGHEYLRIIYGPEYDLPENLERLRARGLGMKRSLAIREFSLGLEALERFVRNEPLRQVHECVFGVLALESEPVDPRL